MGKGRVILQDREAVLDAVPDEQLPCVEKTVMDLFMSRPPFSLLAPELNDDA